MERFAVNISKTAKAKLYNICRLCGIDSPNKVSILNESIIISDEDNFAEEPLFKKISICVGIQVTTNDKMPKTICGLCFDKINDFFEFREMCNSTETQTRKFLGLKEVAKIDVKCNTNETILPNNSLKQNELHSSLNLVAPAIPAKFDKKRGRKRKQNFELLPSKAIKREINFENIEYGLDDKNQIIALTSPKLVNSNKYLSSSIRISGISTSEKVKTDSIQVKAEKKIPKGYDCTVCNINFLSGALLKTHLIKSHIPQIVRYHCVKCNESINNTVEIKNHNLWHKLSKTPYKCTLCSNEIHSLNSYTRHIRDCNKNVYEGQNVLPNIECTNCLKDFQTKNLFYYHHCVTSQLKCPKCRCKLLDQTTTFKHIATCSVIPKNEFSFTKILIKTEPLVKVENEIFEIQRSSVISLSETDSPLITMLYGTKRVIIKPCVVDISFDLYSVAQQKLESSDSNYRKSKSKLHKRQTAEAMERCDKLLKNTMQTLVNIKQEPADLSPISITPTLIEPMVRIKQEILNSSYGDCDVQIRQEIEELNTENCQPILKLKIKNESGKLNSSIVENKTKKKNKKSKKSKEENNKSREILNGKLAKHLPLPIKIKEEVINPEYNSSHLNLETLDVVNKDVKTETLSLKSNETKKLYPILNKSKLVCSSSTKNTLINVETSPENVNETIPAEENSDFSNTTEQNLNVNGENNMRECITKNIIPKITAISAGVNISNYVTKLQMESDFNVVNIKIEKEDPGYNRLDISEVNANVERVETVNINNLTSSTLSEINYDHLPVDFDFQKVKIKQEIEISEKKFNDELESDTEDSDSLSDEENNSDIREKLDEEKIEVVNNQEEKNTDNNIIVNKNIENNTIKDQDSASSVASSELKILKEKPFIENKSYENINSWDHCNNSNEYMPMFTDKEINSYDHANQNLSSEYNENSATIQNANANSSTVFNHTGGSLIISEIFSANERVNSDFTYDSQRKEDSELIESTVVMNSPLILEEAVTKDNIKDKTGNVSPLPLKDPDVSNSNLETENSLNVPIKIQKTSLDLGIKDTTESQQICEPAVDSETGNIESPTEMHGTQNIDDNNYKSNLLVNENVDIKDRIESEQSEESVVSNLDSVIEIHGTENINNTRDILVPVNVESPDVLVELNETDNERSTTSYMLNLTNINEIAENHNNENIEKCLLTQSNNTV